MNNKALTRALQELGRQGGEAAARRLSSAQRIRRAQRASRGRWDRQEQALLLKLTLADVGGKKSAR